MLYDTATEEENNRGPLGWISQSRGILNGFYVAVAYNACFSNSLLIPKQQLELVCAEMQKLTY